VSEAAEAAKGELIGDSIDIVAWTVRVIAAPAAARGRLAQVTWPE
jgi:hypothetical protein